MLTLESITLPAEVVTRLAGPALAMNSSDPQHAAEFIIRHEIERIIRDLEDPMCLAETVRAYDSLPAQPQLSIVER